MAYKLTIKLLYSNKMQQYMMEIYNNKTTQKCWRYFMTIEKGKSIHQFIKNQSYMMVSPTTSMLLLFWLVTLLAYLHLFYYLIF